MDEQALMGFVHKAVAEVGSLLAGSMVVIGDKLGLYRAMAGAGPVSGEQLARATGTSERYVHEWLGAQAAAGYLRYAGNERYELPGEHAIPLTDETSPACVIGAFETAIGAAKATDHIADAFLTGEGFGWGDHDAHVHSGCERFFRPGYVNFLASTWIPALDGVEDRLDRGIEVADVGCGHGASTVHMAKTYPNSTFTGFDLHANSIETARKRAADAGVLERVKFECASAKNITGSYDLITFFDCLHDLGDTRRSSRLCRQASQGRRDGPSGRAEGWRHGGRQPQPGRCRLLRLVDAAMHPQCYGPRRRDGPGRAGRRGQATRCRQPGRVVQVPSGGRDAFQRHLRGADLTSH